MNKKRHALEGIVLGVSCFSVSIVMIVAVWTEISGELGWFYQRAAVAFVVIAALSFFVAAWNAVRMLLIIVTGSDSSKEDS